MYYGLYYQDGLPWCTYFGRYRQEAEWDHGGRSLPIHLLVYVIGGNAVFHIQDSDYLVREGDLFLIQQDTYYSVETTTFCEFYYFHFKGCFHTYSTLPSSLINQWGSGYPAEFNEIVRDPEASCFLTTLMHFQDYRDQLMPICAKMHHYLHIIMPEAEYEFQLIFSQFLLELSKCLRKETGSVSSTLLNKIIYYIHENLSKPLSLNDLAEHFNISKSYLVKLFRQSLNTSVTVYINRTKMDHAAQLLRTSMMNVSEISAFLGYHDPAYFSRVFKKYFGQSPSKYKG